MGIFGIITFETDIVGAGTIIYVDDEPGSGPGNPPENFTSIQVAVNAANPGDTVYVYSGRYTENVVVNKTINLTGEDRDVTIIDGSGISDVVGVDADWVNVSGFTVINGHTDGINLHTVQNCRIFNNTASSNENRGIWLSSSSNNNITGNNALNNNDGIGLSNSFQNNITSNTVFTNENDGISLDFSSENRILNNNASNNENGISIQGSHNNTIKNNNASLNDHAGIYLVDSIGNTLAENTMINNGILLRGVVFEYWNTHDIDTSNTVNGKPVYYWKNRNGGKVPAGAGQVILANCTDISVEGQELTYGSIGIELGYSSNNYIVKNNVSSNNIHGISLWFSNENTISSNFVSSHTWDGIEMRDSDGNNIINNDVSNNMYGLWIGHSCWNNIIDNFVSNHGLGFYLYNDSESNNIISNKISNNNVGIRIMEETSNNLIYHNRIIDNSNQGIDDTNNSNQWDNGYPSGGNYWSDYDGIDLNSTPSQDIPPPDGIGDTPYVIDPDSQDNYPLMDPVISSMYLYEGWNLISIPLIQSETNVGTVLSSISGSYDAVQWYNISDTQDPWKHNHTSKPEHLNDLNDINNTMGFWIHVTEPGGVLFEFSGIKPTLNQSIPLHPGWNLVGYPSFTNKLRDTALNNIIFGTDVDAIQTYDAALKTWEEIGSSDSFELGRGYWVHSMVEKVWEVPL
jgi:parallel beta-helix repeat protein